ncbi:MAG: DUF4129 domain-containing protein [Acidimicrobiales bacterium]
MTSATTRETDQDQHGRTPRWRTAAAIGVCVLLAVGVAVLAAGSEGDDAAVSGPGAVVPSAVFDGVVAFLALAGVAAAILIVAGVVSGSDPKSATHAVQRSAGGAALLVLVFAFVMAANPFDDERGMLGDPSDRTAGAELEPERPTVVDPADAPQDADSPVSTVGVVVGIAMFVALVLALLWMVRRQPGVARDGSPPSDPRQPVDVRRDRMIGLLDDALAALRSHPDPRDAVIAAWVRLGDAFEVVGVERSAADTTSSYLGRALRTIDASAPAVERLIGSFDEALYSTHAIGPDTQAAAVDAVTAVRDELHLLTQGEARA